MAVKLTRQPPQAWDPCIFGTQEIQTTPDKRASATRSASSPVHANERFPDTGAL